MIKLKDLLVEYRSVKGLDTFDSSKENVVFWSDGIIMINPEKPMDAASAMRTLTSKFTGPISIQVDPVKKFVTIFDYDDWSSFKTVPSFQQAIKDLVRLKLVKPNYGLRIGLSNTTKNLGKSTVNALLKYDASYSNTIPRAFHGTTVKDLETIKRLGLVPPSKNKYSVLKWDAFYTDDSPDNIYLSTDFERADTYARHAVGKYKEIGIKTKPVILQVDNLPIDNVVADDDFRSNMSMVHLMSVFQTGKKVDPDSYMSSIRSTAQFGYRGRIPASKITKIHKI